MTRTEITVMGAAVRRTEELADDVPVRHLLPSLVALAGDRPYSSGPWFVTRADGTEILSHETLRDSGIEPGETLMLARRTVCVDPRQPMAASGPPRITPVPRRLTLRERLWGAVSAALGLRIPLVAGDEPMIERARLAWRWSDHGRRLDWLASRHRLRRTVMVAVCSTGPGSPSPASARTAIDLARSLAAVRSDRVAAVFGQLDRGLPGRPGPPLDATIGELDAPETGAVDGLDARFGSPTSAHGVPVVVGPDPDRTSGVGAAEIRRALDRLRAHAGVIVVDVGPLVGDHPALATADQLVVVADGLVTGDVTSALSDRPVLVIDGGLELGAEGLGRLVPGAHPIIDEDEQLRRLTVAVVDGWQRLDALLPDEAAYLWE